MYSPRFESSFIYRLSSSWLRIILEKPFGNNYESALKLIKSLREKFNENELYLVDHYRFKRGIEMINKFKIKNNIIWNNIFGTQHSDIYKISIVMTEKSDCKGRTNYYNDNGNHLLYILNYYY